MRTLNILKREDAESIELGPIRSDCEVQGNCGP